MFNRIKHIRNKIAVGILGCTSLMVIILTTISSGVISSTIKHGAEDNLVWISRYYAKEFSADFQSIEEKVQQLEVFIRNTIDITALHKDRDAYLEKYGEQILPYMQDFAENRTKSKAAWVYFASTWSDTPHDVYLVDGDNDGTAERQDHIPFEYYDNAPTSTDDKEWWYGPVRTKSGFWTNPYEWTLRNNEVIKVASYAMPIYVDGEFIGVVGTYYRFDKLASAIRNIKPYDDSFASLLNEKLDIIVHPHFSAGTRFTSDNLETLNNGSFGPIAKAIKKNPYGVVPYTDEGVSRLYAFAKLSNGWVLAVNPPVDDVYSARSGLLSLTALAALLCLAFSVVVAVAISRSITRPIVTVIEMAKAVGEGNFSVTAQVDTQDEVRSLADSLNTMSAAMHTMNQNLKVSYERMHSIVEGAGMFTWDYYIPLDTFRHNTQFCRAMELPGPAEEGSRPMSWLQEHVHPDDWHHIEHLRDKIGMSTLVNFEMRMRMSSGEWRWFKNMGRVEECDDEGRTLRVAGTGFNVQAQKMAELSEADRLDELERLVDKRTEELVESRNQAQAASEAKTRFLSTVSHEIRTPMNAIVGFTYILDRSNLSPAQVDHLDKIKLSAGALLNVINDVLDISKIEAEKLELEKTPFNLSVLIDTVISIVGFASREKNLQLTVEVDNDVNTAFVGDPKRISQILLNLLNNAVKFTASGKIILRATTDATLDNDNLARLSFTITDTGIGLSEEQIPRLFLPFSQADSSVTRKYGGTGLGLAICKQLVELMGGTIGVESVLGQGSCFQFSLRLLPCDHLTHVDLLPRLPRPDGMDSMDEAALQQIRGVRILLVEDNAINQEIARAVLEEVGAVVYVAENGQEALDMVRVQQYALVFMDMQMPIMDGLESARCMRELGRSEDLSLGWLCSVPIVAMTANAMSEDRDRCLAAGMNAHIGKPIDPVALQNSLALWLRGDFPSLIG